MNNINTEKPSIYRNSSPSIPNYNNDSTFTVTYTKNKVIEDPAVLDFREKMAKKLGLASLIYAIFSTFCLYRNLSGVTMPLFGIATLVYMIYGLIQYDVKIKKTSWFYGSVLLALSISNFLTGNPTILFFNNVGIFLMLFVFLLHNVYDDSRWNFSKTAMSICESVFCSIGALDDFSKDMKVLRQRNTFGSYYSSKKATIKYVLIGLIISIPVVSIILLLLLNADAVFNKFLSAYVLNGYLKLIYNFGDTIGIMITFAIIFFAAYCIMRFFSKKSINEEYTTDRSLEPLIAITVLSIISVIYLVFSLIQIIYLFLGGGTLPEGYNYSQYAREGFFQLLAVSIINFLMVLFVNNHFRESRVLKVLMTIISLCTYIMIASSYVRIMMYIDAFLLTELRIWVLWGLTLLSLLFIAVIISIFKHDFPLFRYSIIVVSVLYVIISFARMDYVIADYNIKNKNIIEAELDIDYLKRLSTDAAPAIYKYSDTLAEEYFENCENDYSNRSWRQFNTSAYTAKVLSETR